MICKKCGKTTVDGVANCIYCGYVFSKDELSANVNDKTIALYDELQVDKPRDRKIVAIVICIVFCVVLAVCITIAVAVNHASESKISSPVSRDSTSVSEEKVSSAFDDSKIGQVLLSDSWLNLTECINKRDEYTYFTFDKDGKVIIQKLFDEDSDADKKDDETYYGKITSHTDTDVHMNTDHYGDIQISFIDDSDLLELSYDNGYGVLVSETVVLSDYEIDSNNVQKQLGNTYWQSGFINQAYPKSIIYFSQPPEQYVLSGELITDNENIVFQGYSYSSELSVIEMDGYIIILELTDDDKKMNAFIEQFSGDVNSSNEVVHAKEQWTLQNR